MYRGGARHPVPVPALLRITAFLRRHRLARPDQLGCTVALISSVTVVRRVYLSAPHIGVICLERQHPVTSAVDSESRIIQDEESFRSIRSRRDPCIAQGRDSLRIGSSKIEIRSTEVRIGSKSGTGEVPEQGEGCKGLDIRLRDEPVERMPSADSDSPVSGIAVISHGQQGMLESASCVFSNDEIRPLGVMAEISYRSECSHRICRIMSSVMERCPVHFQSSESTGGIGK